MTELLNVLKAASTDVGAAFARRAAFYGVVAVLLLAAAGFGLAAGWTLLAEVFDGVTASLIIAGVLAGIALPALIADKIMRRRRLRHRARRVAAHQAALGPLAAQTFIAALQAGQSMGARRH